MKILRGSVRMFASVARAEELHRMKASVVVVLAVLLSGICSSALAVEPRREFTANPELLDFGTVQLGSSKQLTFTLRNIPVNAIGKVCSIKASLVGSTMSTDISENLFTATPASVTLSPNQQPTVQVFYTPTPDQASAFPSGTVPPTSVTGLGVVDITCGSSSDGVRTKVNLKGTVPATPRFTLTVTRRGALSKITAIDPTNAFGNVIKTLGPFAMILCRAESPNGCSSFVLTGKQIQVQAECAPNSHFVGWSGGTGSAAVCNGNTALQCSFTMTAASTITGECAN